MNLYKSSKNFVYNNFHALTHKNFRYYWSGQCLSLMGTWVQNIGQSWLVLSLTNSPLLLGVLGTVQFIPMTIFSLFAGVFIDKFSKKKILIITQSISMMLALILSALVFTHTAKYSYILILAFILGFTNTIDNPTRQSFTVEIAGKEDLMNAIALNSAIFNLARIVGPAIGALFMAYFGAGWCFLLNGLSFIPVLYGIFKIETKPYVRNKSKNANMFKEILDGLKYIFKTPALFQTVLMVAVVGIFVFNYSILVPVFTKGILHQGEKTYGLLMSFLGAGSLIGALFISIKSKSGPKIKIMIIAAIAISIFLMLIGITKAYYISLILLLFTGFFNIIFSTTANSELQVNTKDEYRGRVMSVYSLVFAGATPIGNMFTGFISSKFNAANAFIICGIITVSLILLVTLLFVKKRTSRQQL